MRPFLSRALVVSLLLVPVVAWAQDPTAQVAQAAGFFSGDLLEIIGRLLKAGLGFLGVVALLIVLYAGYLWMTAGGDDKQVNQAKDLLRNGVIGLIIMLSAYAIVSFIFNALGAGGFGSGRDTTNGTVGVERLSGALGATIADHYPGRNATDVPRNTRIIVTFRDEIDPSSILADGAQGGAVLPAAVKIYPSAVGPTAPIAEVTGAFTEDKKTFIFDPKEYLGSPTEDVNYTVVLTTSIRLAGGGAALRRENYEWRFTTGTVLDLTPPTLQSFRPSRDGSFARNILVQLTFDEPMDPSTATGTRAEGSGFDHIIVAASGGNPLPGTYVLSNGYKTVTFVSTDACGTNSCGETIYCLPTTSDMNVTAVAADLSDEPPQSVIPANGLTDVSGNALDGNDDGTAGDDVSWAFHTTGDISLAGPELRGPLSPDISEPGVALDRPITFETSDVLMVSSVNLDSVILDNAERTTKEPHEQWFRHDVSFLDAGGMSVTGRDQVPTRTRVTVPHGTFLASGDEVAYDYQVRVNQGLRNEYQNCFVPAEGPGRAGAASCGVSLAQPYCCNGQASASICPALHP